MLYHKYNEIICFYTTNKNAIFILDILGEKAIINVLYVTRIRLTDQIQDCFLNNKDFAVVRLRKFSSSGLESLGCYLQPTARGCSLRESIEECPIHRSGYPPATSRREDLPAVPLPVLQTRGGLPAADLQSLPR